MGTFTYMIKAALELTCHLLAVMVRKSFNVFQFSALGQTPTPGVVMLWRLNERRVYLF